MTTETARCERCGYFHRAVPPETCLGVMQRVLDALIVIAPDREAARFTAMQAAIAAVEPLRFSPSKEPACPA